MAKEQMGYKKRIVRDPRIMVGKPVVRGTRIPVELVLEYLAANPKLEDLLADYPRLTIDDVKACFAYARAHLPKTQRRTPPDPAPHGTPVRL